MRNWMLKPMKEKARSKRVVPAFATETEEAEWWYKNLQKMAQDFVEAARKGGAETPHERGTA